MAFDQGIEICKVTFAVFHYFALMTARSVSMSNEEFSLKHLFAHIIIASITFPISFNAMSYHWQKRCCVHDQSMYSRYL
jgi:hypothetical protein